MRGQRTERLIRITSKFLEHPSQPLSLTAMAEYFDVSKTVISDDVSMVSDALTQEGKGTLIVDRGRSGGAYYVPDIARDIRENCLNKLVSELSDPKRLLPGGLIYYTDLLFNPEYVDTLGLIMASIFHSKRPTIVMTSEMKGIPLGMATARALGISLAVCRFKNRASDGPAVCVHYPTQSGEVQAMYMGTKMITDKDRVLIIDDFMRGGSTAAGMCQIVDEFRASVAGVGVLLTVDEPKTKAVDGYTALLSLSFSSDGVKVSLYDA